MDGGGGGGGRRRKPTDTAQPEETHHHENDTHIFFREHKRAESEQNADDGRGVTVINHSFSAPRAPRHVQKDVQDVQGQVHDRSTSLVSMLGTTNLGRAWRRTQFTCISVPLPVTMHYKSEFSYNLHAAKNSQTSLSPNSHACPSGSRGLRFSPF